MTTGKETDLDEALADTFPASDPPSQTVPVVATGAARDDAHGPGRVDIYRAVRRVHADDAFGPQPRYPARRWTGEGTPAVYASLSVGGALLEILAHTEGPAPDDLVLAIASVPRECVEEASDLPGNWREYPYLREAQQYGDDWVRSRRSWALQVPSAICDREFNLLINPGHPDRERLHGTELIPLKIDPRVRG
ncbi:MAG: RES family NAD+ phosphorylase [Pseudomonadota bacterium]|nr:RES family NAD+ phosphorylase [Pseudomonadota bacterium]